MARRDLHGMAVAADSVHPRTSLRTMSTPLKKVPGKRPGKAGGKRDENRRRRAETLARAALDLFLERGIEDVTIDEIAERAGTAKGNFYRYYDDKTHLVEALLAPVAAMVRKAMRSCVVDLGRAKTPADASEAYTKLAANLGMVALEHRDVARLYLQEHRGPSTEARMALRKLEADLTKGAFRLSQAAVEHRIVEVEDPRISALALLGAVEHLALVMLRGDVDLSIPQVATTLIRMTLDGLRVRA